MGANITTTSGPVIEKAGDLAGLLTTLQKGDVLFIDEIHRLNKNIEEYLYPAMEDFRLDIIIDQGPNARSVRLNLPRFTLIGATTRAGMISSPLRSRFGLVNRLDYYPAEDLQKVVFRSARPAGTADRADAARVRDRAPRRAAHRASRTTCCAGCATMSSSAPAAGHRRRRRCRADHARDRLGRPRRNGQAPARGAYPQIRRRPGRLNSLAVSVGEEAGTLEEVHEPYLIMEGFLKRTPQGRVAAKRAYDKLGLKPTGSQQELF